jgi:hypothetical protein
MPRRDGEVFFFGTAIEISPETAPRAARAGRSILSGRRAYRGSIPQTPARFGAPFRGKSSFSQEALGGFDIIQPMG